MTSGVGHNSLAVEELKKFVDRMERLDEERSGIVSDMKDVLSEAKVVGFDTKAIKRLLAVRKKDKADVKEQEELFHMYCSAMGYDIFD